MVVKVLGRERGDRWGVGCGTLIIRGWGRGGWRQQECSHILTKGVPEWSLYTSHILTRVVRVLPKGVPPNTHRSVPKGKVHTSAGDAIHIHTASLIHSTLSKHKLYQQPMSRVLKVVPRPLPELLGGIQQLFI